jgi:hypothetical protein
MEKRPPRFRRDEIGGDERIRLADIGITHLKKALEIRPNYRDAMVYLNLVLRQKSMAYFHEPDRWQACVDEAVKWLGKAEKLTVPKEQNSEKSAGKN